MLPQLHTLQFSEVLGSFSHDLFCHDSKALPSLRELVIHNEISSSTGDTGLAGMPADSEDPHPFQLPRRLEALRIIERPYFPSFKVWRDWGWLENTKHVTLGVISHNDTTLTLWNPPPNLETLTLLLGIDPDAPDAPIVGLVYGYIKSKRRSGELALLRFLTLNLVPLRELGQPMPELDMEALCIWAFPLQQLCTSLDIQFGFQQIGECSTAFGMLPSAHW